MPANGGTYSELGEELLQRASDFQEIERFVRKLLQVAGVSIFVVLSDVNAWSCSLLLIKQHLFLIGCQLWGNFPRDPCHAHQQGDLGALLPCGKATTKISTAGLGFGPMWQDEFSLKGLVRMIFYKHPRAMFGKPPTSRPAGWLRANSICATWLCPCLDGWYSA